MMQAGRISSCIIQLFIIGSSFLFLSLVYDRFQAYQEVVKIIIILLINHYMSDQSDASSPPQVKAKSPPKIQNNDKQIELLQENKNLRRKLKQLSARLDDQLQKAAKQKLKASISYVHAASPQSQSLELQNAYKMIERLQKTVKDFESKQSYQISYKRILDLQSIIKKKETEIEQLKIEIKDLKKSIREKQKHVNDLLDKQAVNHNLNEQKQQIQKLKHQLKKIQGENEQLKKKQLQKHKKLVSAQRRIVEMEQEQQEPVAVQQQVLDKLQDYKAKYKQAMVRIEKQNAYITKLNMKVSQLEQSSNGRRVRSYHASQDQNKVSRSMHELPDLPGQKAKPTILDHIPSPNIPLKLLKRY